MTVTTPTNSTATHAPGYLSGILEPVAAETEARNLEVTGSLPPQLSGRYLRIGPNPRPGTDPGHLWAGAGMLHGVRIHDGQAEWYRNRWVRTKEGHRQDFSRLSRASRRNARRGPRASLC